MKHTWYNSSDWEKKDQQEFLEEIKKTKSQSKKTEFIISKSKALRGSVDKIKKEAGEKLLIDLINSHTSIEESGLLLGVEQFADYLKKEKRYTDALHYYKLVVDLYLLNGTRSWTSGNADLNYIDLIIESETITLYQWAKDYLINSFFVIDNNIELNKESIQYFRYSYLLAILLDELGDSEGTIRLSQESIQLADDLLKRIGLLALEHLNHNMIIRLKRNIIEAKIRLIS